MSRIRQMLVCAAVLAVAVPAAAAGIDAERYLNDIKYLASPELKGRGTGTPELESAAAYIAGQFRILGLRPLAACHTPVPRACTEDLSNYYQPFAVTVNARPGPRNKVWYSLAGNKRTLQLDEDFVPLNFSGSGHVSGEVVFAGYGITAPEYGYDDYAGVDVRNKIVMILRHEPQEFDENSAFAGKILTGHAQFWTKAANARRHGARGVIFISDTAHHPGEFDQLESMGNGLGPASADIAAIQIKAEAAKEWLKASGADLGEIQAGIDKTLKPHSFALSPAVHVDFDAEVSRQTKTVHNVAAFLPGETSEYLIIGAHYDHLGLGEQFSMAPGMSGTPHPGADDNASGTAGVLELARLFAAGPKPKRGILFLAFAGEEFGLLGSGYYVEHPDLPLSSAIAMINLDMIGRLREGRLYVGGTGGGATFRGILQLLASKHHLNPDYSGSEAYGSSDHASFTARQVPVLFFFSGLHGDYHKPSDTWDKINAPAAAELLNLVAELSQKLLQASDRPRFAD